MINKLKVKYIKTFFKQKIYVCIYLLQSLVASQRNK